MVRRLFRFPGANFGILVISALWGVISAAQDGGGEIFNVASGEFHTMEEVALALGAEVKWIPRREWEVSRHHGDISKLLKLGWKPKTDVINWISGIIK